MWDDFCFIFFYFPLSKLKAFEKSGKWLYCASSPKRTMGEKYYLGPRDIKVQSYTYSDISKTTKQEAINKLYSSEVSCTSVLRSVYSTLRVYDRVVPSSQQHRDVKAPRYLILGPKHRIAPVFNSSKLKHQHVDQDGNCYTYIQGPCPECWKF